MTRLDSKLIQLRERERELNETIQQSQNELEDLYKGKNSERYLVVSMIEKYAKENLIPIGDQYKCADGIDGGCMRQFFYDTSKKEGLDIKGVHIGGLELHKTINPLEFERYVELRRRSNKASRIANYAACSVVGFPLILPALIFATYMGNKANKICSSLDSLTGMDVVSHISEKIGETS
ncbi:hypothetical protein K8R33_01140 [archaeon]|nr:hypothetical protein [archaeon]